MYISVKIYVNWVVFSQQLGGITQTVARARPSECMIDLYGEDVTNRNIHNFIGILAVWIFFVGGFWARTPNRTLTIF